MYPQTIVLVTENYRVWKVDTTFSSINNTALAWFNVVHA